MIEELKTDDEAMRESALTQGPTKAGKFQLRPVTALSLSWLQRHSIFDDGWGDTLQKTAAFGYLHAADKSEIRAVINDRQAFLDAVDDWMDENVQHHDELEPVSEAMERSLEEYMAASTTAANPSTPEGSASSGN